MVRMKENRVGDRRALNANGKFQPCKTKAVFNCEIRQQPGIKMQQVFSFYLYYSEAAAIFIFFPPVCNCKQDDVGCLLYVSQHQKITENRLEAGPQQGLKHVLFSGGFFDSSGTDLLNKARLFFYEMSEIGLFILNKVIYLFSNIIQEYSIESTHNFTRIRGKNSSKMYFK